MLLFLAEITDSCKLPKIFADPLNHPAPLMKESVRVNRAEKMISKSKIKSSYIKYIKLQ